MAAERKKVLCPMTGKNGKTYWVKLGSAFVNRDGSTNVYLDAYPVNNKLQIRDDDERDRREDPGGKSYPGFLGDEGRDA